MAKSTKTKPTPPEENGPKPEGIFTDELKACLDIYTYVETVWIDESGNWYLAEVPGLPSYSRDEILNG